MAPNLAKTRVLVAAAMLLAAVCTPHEPASGCLHGAAGGKAKVVTVSAQRAIVFHAGERQELIMELDAELSGEGTLPESLGWVITVPTSPDTYSTAISPRTFEDVAKLYRDRATLSTSWKQGFSYGGVGRSGGPTRSFGQSAPPPIVVTHETVGPYEIDRIETAGDAAAAVVALNAWFERHGFGRLSGDDLKEFVDRRETFLCVRTDPRQGSAKDGARRVTFPPLRISFASRDIRYPVKFLARNGAFALDLLIFSDRPLDLGANEETLSRLNVPATATFTMSEGNARRRFLRTIDVKPADLTSSSLTELFRQLRQEGRLHEPPLWFLSRIFSPAVNTARNSIAEWPGDVRLKKSAHDQPPPSPSQPSGTLTPAELNRARQVARDLRAAGQPALVREMVIPPPNSSPVAPAPATGTVETSESPAEAEEPSGETTEMTMEIDLADDVLTSEGMMESRIARLLTVLPAPVLLSVDASRSRLSNAGVRQLCELPGLVKLDLGRSRADARCLKDVAKHARLQRLRLDSFDLREPGCLRALAACETLESLDVRRAKFGPDSLRQIARMPNVVDLDLSETTVAADDLALLGDRPRFDRLAIEDTDAAGSPRLSSLIWTRSTILPSPPALSPGYPGTNPRLRKFGPNTR